MKIIIKRLFLPIIIIFLYGCEKEPLIISGESIIVREAISYDGQTDHPVSGRAEWFYANGQLKTYIYFVDGKRNGLNEDFYEDGRLAERSTYIDGKRNGLHEEYYSNGELMERRHYIYGKGNGSWEWFREDGTLEKTKYYVNGLEVEE